MKMTKGWYMRWANDPFETEWVGNCPAWIASMRKAAARDNRELIQRPIRYMVPKSVKCSDCGTSH